MVFSLKLGGVIAPVFLLIALQWFTFTKAELPICSESKEGNRTLYRKVSGDDGVVICFKNSGKYVWTFLDGSSTLGEKFNPAKDCPDIVDNVPEAKDGFYWFALGQLGPSKDMIAIAIGVVLLEDAPTQLSILGCLDSIENLRDQLKRTDNRRILESTNTAFWLSLLNCKVGNSSLYTLHRKVSKFVTEHHEA